MKKRIIFFTILTLIGGFLFVPYSYESWTLPLKDWLIFPFGSAIVILLLSWLGIKLSDKTNLPMPILRKWENSEKIEQKDWKILLIPAMLGAILALIIVGISQFFDTPKNQGTLLMRILTTPWAATVTEVVSHLFVMSLLILLLKNKWVGIILSSIIFLILFHLQEAEGDIKVTIFLGAGNFAGSTLTGWFYSKYGFESAVIGHATMHIILLSIN